MDCPKLVRGKVARFGKVDECGLLLPGPQNLVVTKGVISVVMTPVNDTGTAITAVNAAGEQEVDETPRPRFKRFDVNFNFIGVNPVLLAMLSNQETWDGIVAGEVTGFTIADDRSPEDAGFFTELWSGTAGRICEGGVRKYGYFGLPWVGAGAVDAITWANDNISFNITGAQTMAPNSWGVGPFDVTVDEADAPAPLRVPLGERVHFIYDLVGLAPPEPDCDPAPLGVLATTATAGIPGTTSPAFSYLPQTLTELQASDVDASPLTAWTTDQYVELGDGSTAHWTGSAWAAGPAA